MAHKYFLGAKTHKKPPQFKPCARCGVEFTEVPSEFERRRFCSRKCAALTGSEKAKLIPYNQKKLNGRLRKDGYRYVRIPNHPLSSKEGYVAAHRLAAEKKIGRYLKPNEVVHHWDENPLNNEPDNLCILRNQSAHAKLHMFAKWWGVPVSTFKFEQPWLCQQN